MQPQIYSANFTVPRAKMNTNFNPIYLPKDHPEESAASQNLISLQNLEPHPEGGYYALKNVNPLTIPNPFKDVAPNLPSTKPISSSIHYLLTPHSAKGHWHRNRSTIYHAQHCGSARYIVIHAAEWEPGKHARIESFVLGPNADKGEVLQLTVQGGTYKASYLIDAGGDEVVVNEKRIEGPGCLISEVVVPGFGFEGVCPKSEQCAHLLKTHVFFLQTKKKRFSLCNMT